MTLEDLIAEGRRLQRKTMLLEPEGKGDVAAYWYGYDYEVLNEAGDRCWLSVNTNFIPNFDRSGWLSLFTHNKGMRGHIEISKEPYDLDGIQLFAREISVLPTLNVVYAHGSKFINEWLAERKPKRWSEHGDAEGDALEAKYMGLQCAEDPFCWEDAYATLGGWHLFWPNGTREFLVDKQLLVHTYRNSEPWVEGWQKPSGEFEVVQQIT